LSKGRTWLLPSSLDDYVTADNPVRVIEVFIDELDLGALGFPQASETVSPVTFCAISSTGRSSGRC